MSAFKAGQTVWRHKTQLVRGCAERAAKLTSPIQEEILQSGYWGFSAETYCLGGIRQPENRESAQYTVQSRVFSQPCRNRRKTRSYPYPHRF